MDTQGKELMLVSTEVPEDCIRRAQVAIVTENGWYLLVPGARITGLSKWVPLPKVTCPVVDITPIRMDDDDKMMKIMSVCVSKTAGVINLAGLLIGLEALGAKVTSQSVSHQSSVISKPRAQDVAIAFYERKKKRVARRVNGGKAGVN